MHKHSRVGANGKLYTGYRKSKHINGQKVSITAKDATDWEQKFTARVKQMEDCIHHWLIGSPSGNDSWSTGRCKKCKLVKQFDNTYEPTYSSWMSKRRPTGAKKRS